MIFDPDKFICKFVSLLTGQGSALGTLYDTQVHRRYWLTKGLYNKNKNFFWTIEKEETGFSENQRNKKIR